MAGQLQQRQKTVTDTITTRDLRLAFPPKKSSAFDIVFSLTDKQTNVSSYKELHIKTVYPYVNSWLVLNGDKENARISAVEDPDSLNYVFTEDAYTALGYKKRFEDITELVYAPAITENVSAPEWLYIVSPDSVWALFPFEMKVEKSRVTFCRTLSLPTKPKWHMDWTEHPTVAEP